MTVRMLHIAYAGEPREIMDLAVKKIADQYGGTLGDCGWGCGERDIEIEFETAVSNEGEIASAMTAAGCLSADWSEW